MNLRKVLKRRLLDLAATKWGLVCLLLGLLFVANFALGVFNVLVSDSGPDTTGRWPCFAEARQYRGL